MLKKYPLVLPTFVAKLCQVVKQEEIVICKHFYSTKCQHNSPFIKSARRFESLAHSLTKDDICPNDDKYEATQ